MEEILKEAYLKVLSRRRNEYCPYDEINKKRRAELEDVYISSKIE